MVQGQSCFLYLQGQEYTEEFLLEYQREDGGEWMRFKNKRGEEVTSSYSISDRQLSHHGV